MVRWDWQTSLRIGHSGAQLWRIMDAKLGGLNLMIYECTHWRALLSGHLEKLWWFPLKPDQPFCCHKEMALLVAVAWCHTVSQLILSLTGWPWTRSFTSQSPKSPLQWKERWTRGSAGTLPVPYQLSHPSSDLDAPLFLLIHIGPGVFKCSLTTQPFSTPSQPLRKLSLLVSQETPFCQWHPELKNAIQAVQVSRIPCLHPVEHGGVG